ncbi:hypothetical protein HHI36_016235 [Cryptolaemus montrouzieri]|uniref:Charged multivesicular body protein 7 n=1 Tax=Cryptolaemus montrouzieri TaxID=559131 RepID=A0ABD2NIW2_9CUCU
MNMKDILEKQDVDMNNAENYKLLFISLRNRGKVQIIELPHKDDLNNFLVKFSGDHELLPISEVDLAVYNLERNEKVLEKNIEILEDNISGCVDEAKHHLKKGHKQLAKACLRKKHEIEKRVDKKLEALQNVQILLQRLQDTKMDNSVWESYKKSLAALEATYNKGFNEDAVEDTMLKIGEMLEINSDIQNTLSRPLIQEDADLEEELAELMNDKNDGNSPQNMDDLDLSKLNISLPDVPNSPISDTSEKNISTQLI